ncbi:MAG: NAD-dependent malic enzyme, partial [Acidobacteria bacterium]|nr:NAD-dependent malic enzyme [Acidobacteriota bacterium]
MLSIVTSSTAKLEFPTGTELLRDPILNKGTAFTLEERRTLRLEGLLPSRVSTIEQQEDRIIENFRSQPNDLAKYVLLL